MNLFELRYGDSDRAWTDWRNEQIDTIDFDAVEKLGTIATRPDPIPYGDTSETIDIPRRRIPIDLLSQGI